MKPKRIWLQIVGSDDPDGEPDEVTWCEDKIYSTDAEYVEAEEVERQKELVYQWQRLAVETDKQRMEAIVEVERLRAENQRLSSAFLETETIGPNGDLVGSIAKMQAEIEQLRRFSAEYNAYCEEVWERGFGALSYFDWLETALAEEKTKNDLFSNCLLRAARMYAERNLQGELVFPDGAIALAKAMEELVALKGGE